MTAPIKIRDLPATLHGYPVIAWSLAKDRQTALVILEREGRWPHPIVAATWWPELADGWQWGHYFGDLTDAETYRTEWRGRHGEFANEGTPVMRLLKQDDQA